MASIRVRVEELGLLPFKVLLAGASAASGDFEYKQCNPESERISLLTSKIRKATLNTKPPTPKPSIPNPKPTPNLMGSPTFRQPPQPLNPKSMQNNGLFIGFGQLLLPTFGGSGKPYTLSRKHMKLNPKPSCFRKSRLAGAETRDFQEEPDA